VANIKSQIKRNRQNDKRRLRNRVQRGTARIAVRSARTAIDAGVPESKSALMQAISTLDKAAEKGVIHKNNAARRKSRLMKAFAKMEPVQMEAVPAMVEPVAEPEVKKTAARKRGTKAEPEAEVATESTPVKVKKTATKKASATPKKTVAKKKA
jgi:small subunit ribosomal protein S20